MSGWIDLAAGHNGTQRKSVMVSAGRFRSRLLPRRGCELDELGSDQRADSSSGTRFCRRQSSPSPSRAPGAGHVTPDAYRGSRARLFARASGRPRRGLCWPRTGPSLPPLRKSRHGGRACAETYGSRGWRCGCRNSADLSGEGIEFLLGAEIAEVRGKSGVGVISSCGRS